MRVEIGQVETIFRYPVKSMGGERLDSANLGWHGLDGDRRLALRRMDDRGAFPWLSASKLPDLVLFTPLRREDGAGGHLPTHVRTPDGEEMDVFGADLAAEVGRRHGAPVQMTQLRHGIFDEGSLSVIAVDTVREIGRLAPSTGGNPRRDLRAALRIVLQGASVVGADVPGRDRVHLDAGLSPLVGERLGDPGDGVLARRVAGDVDPPAERQQRGDVDDLAPPAG